LGHVKNRDILTMSIVATLAGAIMMIASVARWAAFFGIGGRSDRDGSNLLTLLVGVIVAPIAATMIQMAVSRAREYEADAMSARLTGSPDELISALRKLERGSKAMPDPSVSPQMAHMFIINPFGDLARGISTLFQTHPPTEKRIAALQALAGHAQPQGPSPWS
jgi:heat shock protein HtpX